MTRIIMRHLHKAIDCRLLPFVRLFSTVVLLSSLFFALNSFAADDGTWTYNIIGDTAEVTGCVETCPTVLVIPEIVDGYSVIGIGERAFNIRQLTSVMIPDSVNYIGESAFRTNQLTSVTIPDSVTSIGDYVFARNQLTNVTIPDSVTSIGVYAFAYNQLTSVIIPDSITSIGVSTFQGNQLTNVFIPDTVTSIGGFAFDHNKLTNVTLPDSVTSIGAYVFAYNQLTSVIIPDSVTIIGGYAFSYNQLTSVTIPDIVTNIGNNIYFDNPGITSEGLRYLLISGNAVVIGCAEICPENLVIPEIIEGYSVTRIWVAAFAEKRLTKVTIPDSVTSIGESAFRSNQLTNVTIPDSVTSILKSAFSNNQLTSVTIGDSVNSIGESAFSDNQLTNVTIPDSVTNILKSAFSNNQLTSVIFGSEVTNIGVSAFRSNQLTNVTIPDSVTSILKSAFSNNQLTSVIFGSAVTHIGESVFSSNQLANVTIPDSVTSIGESAFRSNQLTKLTIPDSVTSIGGFAFEDNQLTNVIIPDSVTSIGGSAFKSNQITSVIIPDSVTSIGGSAFKSNQITSVIIPDGVTSIGGSAFKSNQITSVTIGDSVNNIGESAFSDNQLTNVIIPDSVTSIGGSAFKNNQLTSVTIGDSVTSIGGSAFSDNQLNSVTIPASVTSIGNGAFNQNELINSVRFLGGRPAGLSGAFDESSLYWITYCSNTTGWPGNQILIYRSADYYSGRYIRAVGDCDGDGISNDADPDDDNDGLADSVEIALGSNPRLVDSDKDGLPDKYEVAVGSDPNLADTDNDGLTDNIDNSPLVFDESAPTLYSGQLTVLPDMNDDAIHEVGILKVDSEAGKVQLDVLSGKDQILLNTIVWTDSFEDSTLSLHLIPDMNDNGADEVGLFGIQDGSNNEGKPQMFVRDLETGSRVNVYNWPANWKEVSALVLSDISGDGIAEIAIQGRFKDGNRPQLVVKNGDNGSSEATYAYPDLFDAPMFYQHSDVDGDGFEEIATFGRISRNGKIQIKIANGINPSDKMKAYNFPDKWDDVSWHRLDDSNGDGIDDWGLFGISKVDGRPQLINKDGKDPSGALRLYAWTADLSVPKFLTIPDMNNDGVDEVAVAGLRSNGRTHLQVKDGTDRNTVLANHNLNLNLQNVSYHVLPDLSGDEQSELGFLGINLQGEYELFIRHGDTANEEYARHNLGSDWQNTPEITSLGDTDDDGQPDLLIYGQNSAGQELIITSL